VSQNLFEWGSTGGQFSYFNNNSSTGDQARLWWTNYTDWMKAAPIGRIVLLTDGRMRFTRTDLATATFATDITNGKFGATPGSTTPVPTPPPAPPPANDAVVIFDSQEWANTTITATSGNNNQDRYIRGGAFNNPLFSRNSIYQWWELAITGNSLPNPSAFYAETTFKNVMGRGGSLLRVMSHSIKADSPGTGVEQLRLTEYQTQGLAGSTRSEPIFYQRMWVKFDERTLARAQRVGSTNFYHIFWECKCEPDYRLRIQLQYNGSKLIWVSHTDILTNANHIYSGSNSTVNVVLATQSNAAGWHRIEVYMNRPAGIFRTAVDGQDILNVAGMNLMGASNNIANFPMFTQNYCAPAINSSFVNDAPAEVLFSGLKFWDKPPVDAWQAGVV
jgi:hypothetical protein